MSSDHILDLSQFPNGIVVLISDETPLPSGKMTLSQAGWMMSLCYFGGFFGTFFFGYVTNHFGRKWPIFFTTTLSIVSDGKKLPQFLVCKNEISIEFQIGWLLIFYAQNVYYLYGSRMILGFFGSGTCFMVPIFLMEISSNRYRIIDLIPFDQLNNFHMGLLFCFWCCFIFSSRGKIITSMGISSNAGLLIGFILGAFFNYFITPLFAIALLFLFAFIFVAIPETPSSLFKQDKIMVNAADSNRWNIANVNKVLIRLFVEDEKIN